MKKLLVVLVLSLFISACTDDNTALKDTVYKEITVKTPMPLADCVEGGIIYEKGEDVNENGILDTNEILTTQHVCNNEDGVNYNIPTTLAEPEIPIVWIWPAYNLKCGDGTTDGAHPGFGGKQIHVGFDTDGDNYLMSDGVVNELYGPSGEVLIFQNLCKVSDTSEILVTLDYFEPDTECVNGGYVINFGVDQNGDKFLDTDEVVHTETLCII